MNDVKKKEKGNPTIIWITVISAILMFVILIIPMTKMNATKSEVVERLNEKYNDEFILVYSDLTDTPMQDSFEAIVQSKTTGANFNTSVVDGEPEIHDYELELFHMEINTLAEEQFENSTAMTYSDEKAITVRIITTNSVQEEQMQQFAVQVKEQFEVAAITVETTQLPQEAYDQVSLEITSSHQRSTIGRNVNFDNFEPVVKTIEI